MSVNLLDNNSLLVLEINEVLYIIFTLIIMGPEKGAKL